MIIQHIETGKNVAALDMATNLAGFWAENGYEPADYTITYTAEEQRQIVRGHIFADTDLMALVGKIADATAIALHAIGTLTASLDTATTLTEVKAAMLPFAPLLSAYSTKIDDGTIKVPYIEKGGLGVVMPEIEAAGTAAAAAFTA